MKAKLLLFVTVMVIVMSSPGRVVLADAHVYAYPVVLKGSDQLRDGSQGAPLKFEDGTALVWIDLLPEARFAHPTLYLLFHGQKAKIVQGSWWPVLNGQGILYGVASPLLIKTPRPLPSGDQKAGGESGDLRRPKVEREIVVPLDTTPFKIQRRQIVRLTGEGIAGAAITAKVTGPGAIVAENAIITVKDGHVLIGTGNREFQIRATGKGLIDVEITSTPPQPNEQPTVTHYKFEVE